MVESVNGRWNNSIPVTKPRPQPDYAVGFERSAFPDGQLSKLQPILGDSSRSSYFKATYYMHFSFLTCEVECGSARLDIADRQNAHSMRDSTHIPPEDCCRVGERPVLLLPSS
jgi:hypothetical protein